MIITSVQAKNILRYAELELTNLPRRGLIGISGANESGKTTIAEILCLALFGRTFSHAEDEIQKNIKWGEFGGSVTLGFLAKDKRKYLIIRSFDADGNHSAQLRRDGEAEPFVRGAAAVNENVAQLCGFTYQRFIDSFYLAQRNIAAPSILQQTTKALAGVETFEQVATECEQDIHTLQAELIPLNGDIVEARQQRSELNIQADTLPNLKTQRNAQAQGVADRKKENTARQARLDSLRGATTEIVEQAKKMTQASLDTRFQQWLHYADQIETATQAVHAASERAESGSGPRLTGALRSWSDDLHRRLQAFSPVRESAGAYRQRLAWLIGQGDRPAAVDARARSFPEQTALLISQREGIRSKRAGAMVGLFATLLLMLSTWTALWFINHAPAHALGQWLSTDLQLTVTHNAVLVPVAAVSSGLSLLFLVMIFFYTGRTLTAQQETERLQKQQGEIKAQLRTLDDLPQQALATRVATLSACDDAQLKETTTQFTSGPGAWLLDTETFSAFVAPLEAASQTCLEDADALARRIAEEMKSVETSIAATHQDLERLDQATREEESRLNKAAQLDRQVTTLEKDVDTKTQSIEVRRIAQNLLAGSQRRLLGRFNLEMRHVVSKIMPKLTDGRYETMQIDTDLNVQVWSNEKGHFVSLNEVSGGTYNQVMLAIRLALSQALITAALCGAEFIIFDEPFAFFDVQRTRKTLEILPQLSPDIEQMWIIAQQFDDNSPFALHLHCSQDSEVMIASGSGCEALEG